MSQIHIQRGLHVKEASEACPLPQLSHRQGPSHLHYQASWIAFDTGVPPGWAIEAPRSRYKYLENLETNPLGQKITVLCGRGTIWETSWCLCGCANA